MSLRNPKEPLLKAVCLAGLPWCYRSWVPAKRVHAAKWLSSRTWNLPSKGKEFETDLSGNMPSMLETPLET